MLGEWQAWTGGKIKHSVVVRLKPVASEASFAWKSNRLTVDVQYIFQKFWHTSPRHLWLVRSSSACTERIDENFCRSDDPKRSSGLGQQGRSIAVSDGSIP